MTGTAGRTLPVAAAAVAVAVVVVVAVVVGRLIGAPHASPVGGAGPGWKTIEYAGVRIDIPVAWKRLDRSGCESAAEHWGPPPSDPCAFERGVGFYVSASFDPAYGPGVRRSTEDGTSAWGGYVLAGDLAVYASSEERGVVKRVLDSARASG